MAFRPPVFNLTCRVWRWYAGPYTSTHAGGVDSLCQLRYYRTGAAASEAYAQAGLIGIALPARTDIRPNNDWGVGINGDIVECPKGSGRFYEAQFVDDVARGFSNEYRLVFCTHAQAPYPLP
jgi:hypothetical protein